MRKWFEWNIYNNDIKMIRMYMRRLNSFMVGEL